MQHAGAGFKHVVDLVRLADHGVAWHQCVCGLNRRMPGAMRMSRLLSRASCTPGWSACRALPHQESCARRQRVDHLRLGGGSAAMLAAPISAAAASWVRQRRRRGPRVPWVGQLRGGGKGCVRWGSNFVVYIQGAGCAILRPGPVHTARRAAPSCATAPNPQPGRDQHARQQGLTTVPSTWRSATSAQPPAKAHSA